jgi:arylsulfatase
MMFSADETADVGCDTGTTVSPDYSSEGSRFTGEIKWIQVDIGEDAADADHMVTAEERIRIAMAKQ